MAMNRSLGRLCLVYLFAFVVAFVVAFSVLCEFDCSVSCNAYWTHHLPFFHTWDRGGWEAKKGALSRLCTALLAGSGFCVCDWV